MHSGTGAILMFQESNVCSCGMSYSVYLPINAHHSWTHQTPVIVGRSGRDNFGVINPRHKFDPKNVISYTHFLPFFLLGGWENLV